MSLTTQHSSKIPISVDRLQVFWENLAEKYFSGRLPPIGIEWSSRLTASTGMFVSQVGPRSQRLNPMEQQGCLRVIRLSLPLLHNQPESEIVRTLAHEMIHQWEYDVKKRRPRHGGEFLTLMARMNGDGLGITVRHSLKQEVEVFTKYAWQCDSCGQSYRRQRRTISLQRHRCGRCQGNLRELSVSSMARVEDSFMPIRIDRQSHESSINDKRKNDHPQQLVLNFD